MRARVCMFPAPQPHTSKRTPTVVKLMLAMCSNTWPSTHTRARAHTHTQLAEINISHVVQFMDVASLILHASLDPW